MQTTERLKILSDLAVLRPEHFEALALRVFRYQYCYNPLYARFVDLSGHDPEKVHTLGEIPHLPIVLFKHHDVKTGEWVADTYFTSSGTSGQTPSRHAVRSLDFYRNNCSSGFESVFGAIENWILLALLPAYQERTGSSLVAMTDYLMARSAQPENGYFLYDHAGLAARLQEAQRRDKRVMLIGVSFALLDFAEKFPMPLSGVTLLETGGMKGRRREMTRMELHASLAAAFPGAVICSEYGMTELFSQAYSNPNMVFVPSPTMRCSAVEINDPFCLAAPGRTGVLQVADLANVDTCSFLATEDVGQVYADGSFTVLGRLDAAEMRGCNLMVE